MTWMVDCWPAWKRASASAGATTTTSTLPVGKSGLRLGQVGDDGGDVQPAPGQILVRLDVGRQAGVRRHDDDRLERSILAVVAEPEDGHDQERSEDEADAARPGRRSDLDELLADERQQPQDHRREALIGRDLRSGPPPRVPMEARRSRARWSRPGRSGATRIANTSSNVGRSSRALTTSPPARGSPRPRRASPVPASSTMTVNVARPVLADAADERQRPQLHRHRTAPRSRSRSTSPPIASRRSSLGRRQRDQPAARRSWPPGRTTRPR